MKKIFVLATAVSMTALSANAQYYQQPQYQTVQYRTAYQAQPQQQQYTPHAVCQSCYLRPYVGLDYSFNMVDFGRDEGEDLDDDYEDNFHAGSVSLGVRLHDDFALEGYYKRSAKNKKNGTYGGYKFTTEGVLQSFGVDAVFHSPRLGYDNRVELIGSLGVAWYEIKEDINMPAFGTYTEKGHAVGGRAGIGLQYYINNNLALRLMGRYNYTNIENAKHMFELDAGVRYYF